MVDSKKTPTYIPYIWCLFLNHLKIFHLSGLNTWRAIDTTFFLCHSNHRSKYGRQSVCCKQIWNQNVDSFLIFIWRKHGLLKSISIVNFNMQWQVKSIIHTIWLKTKPKLESFKVQAKMDFMYLRQFSSASTMQLIDSCFARISC